VEFTTRPNGIIDVGLGEDHMLMADALNDALSSRAPRFAVHSGVSTYWIDRAEHGLRRAMEARSIDPFASGNVWCLRLDEGRIIAAYDFAPEEDADTLPLDDFLSVLVEWRAEVISAGGVSGEYAAALRPDRPQRPMGPST
jgi:hypothetical protein